MTELINFFKDIFMISDENSKVGLSQFKTPAKEPVKKVAKIQPKEIKLSDLMRKSA